MIGGGFGEFYVPNNAALIVTGDVTEDRVIAAARHHFGDWKRGADPFADRPIHGRFGPAGEWNRHLPAG